jgi:hypothetical protein
VIAQPIVLDLPQPMAAIQLKHSVKPATSTHSHPTLYHPSLQNSSQNIHHEIHSTAH